MTDAINHIYPVKAAAQVDRYSSHYSQVTPYCYEAINVFDAILIYAFPDGDKVGVS